MITTVECPKCGRQTGVRRTACIYCGESLPATDELAGLQIPSLKFVEEWESGYSVILAPLDQESATERQILRLAEIAHIEDSEARELLGARVSLPVARVGSAESAELVARLLGDAELGSTVVPDAALALDTGLRRVREVSFEDDRIAVQILWGDRAELAREDVVVAVTGRIVSTKVDIIESLGKERKGFDVEEASQYFMESYAIDVYGPTFEEGFRIKADSFDFGSVLERPSIRVDRNVASLGALIEEYLGASRYDSDFSRVAKMLDHAWPRESRLDSRGLRARGDFKKHTASSVTTDSMRQFTRYSRTRFHLRNA